MGKASKWIKNFLVGKKEEKNKKKDVPIEVISIESSANSPNSILTKVKRRWSFRKRAISRTDFVLRSMKSFDSIVNSEKLAKALVKYSGNEQVGTTKVIVPAKQGLLEHGAATKIQAAFRSYLARRALCALRALVKLQALVRGYLVRKRTSATLRCMHSLISIQVRARVQRIWLSDESQSFSQDRTGPRDLVQHKQAYNGTDQTIIGQKQVNSKTKRISRNPKEIKRIDTGLTHFSPRVPISDQEVHMRTPSSFSNVSTRQNSPRAKRSKQNVPANFSGSLPVYNPWMPNYMANTESSRAKARSHSEPKQRPTTNVKQKNRRSTSNERLDFNPDDLAHSSSVNMSKNGPKNRNPWLAKLYQSAKGVAKEKEYDSSSVTTDSSSNSRSIMAFEPPVNLY